MASVIDTGYSAKKVGQVFSVEYPSVMQWNDKIL